MRTSGKHEAERPKSKEELKTIQNIRPKKVINNEPCYSLTQVAVILGVSKMTVFRWLNNIGKHNEIEIRAYKDSLSGYHYVSAESVERLQNRFKPLS